MSTVTPEQAIAASPPPGRWAVGVSGGADSVALLELLRGRDELASGLSLRCRIARRSEIEPGIDELPSNPSARYRAARLALFRRVVEEEHLDGVVLAHHADDQAETVLQRLLRGSGPAGLVGMRVDTIVSGVRIIRPLLGVRRAALREMLRARGVAWREDASNESLDQQRNRVRATLARHPALSDAAIGLGAASAALVAWLRSCGPELGDEFDVRALQKLPPPVAREAARCWLAAHVPAGEEIPTAAADRLIEMASDAASPARQHFPGGILVRRRGGMIGIDATG